MFISALEGHSLWSSTYDSTPNALLALDQRILSSWLGPLDGLKVYDIGCGTGRWVEYARAQNACTVGFDACIDMLREGARKSRVQGCVAGADAALLPVKSSVADVVICSLCLSYMQDPFPAIREMARITRPGGRVVISDLHGDAERAGWKRSFRAGGIEYELLHRPHSRDVLVEHAKLAGLALVWQTAPCFGEPERHVFRSAGKENLFEPASQVSALQAIGWRRL